MKSTFISSRDYSDITKSINTNDLCFHDLLKLRHKLLKENGWKHLSMLNRIALSLINKVLDDESYVEEWVESTIEYVEAVHMTLKWIVATCADCYMEEDDYETVLDAAASLLIKVYSDKSILPVLVEIAFLRNRNGRFCNDLIWIIFESRCIDALLLIAKYLDSSDAKDVQLARRLLGFIQATRTAKNEDVRGGSNDCIDWIEENKMFLYYTGESFQESVSPKAYRVSLAAKYIMKPVLLETGNFTQPLLDGELVLVRFFRQLDVKTRKLLANYSYSLYKKDKVTWKEWIDCPITMQVNFAYRERLRNDKDSWKSCYSGWCSRFAYSWW
jgi:hypothetical protein